MTHGDEEMFYFVLLVNACRVGYGSGCVISFFFFKLQKYWFDVHICSVMVEWGVILYFRVIMNPGSIRTELEAEHSSQLIYFRAETVSFIPALVTVGVRVLWYCNCCVQLDKARTLCRTKSDKMQWSPRGVSHSSRSGRGWKRNMI